MSFYTKLTIALSLSVCTLTSSFAATFPRGCEVSGFGFQDPYVTLNDTGDQTLFFIQNRSNLSIELERVVTEEAFMSPKLQTKLGAGLWAAFASDVSNTHFQCLTRGEDNVAVSLKCADLIEICQYPRVKFALSNMGSYWVSTNKPQSQVIKDATDKGIYLKW